RGERGGFVEGVRLLRDLGFRGQAGEQRIGSGYVRHLEGAGRGLPGSVLREVVRRGHADTPLADDPHSDAGVLTGGALVDGRVREAGQAVPLVEEQNLHPVRARKLQGRLDHGANIVGSYQSRHQRTPTWTLRNLAG